MTITAESLGLSPAPLPTDPEAALTAALAQDNEDALQDQQSFALKTRRAIRLEDLKALKVHRTKKLTWIQFVNRYFPGGYETWSRYRSVAQVQRYLYENRLPFIGCEAQARAVAPHLKKEDLLARLKEALSERNGVFPNARRLRETLAAGLNPPSHAKGSQKLVHLLRKVLEAATELPKADRETIHELYVRLSQEGSNPTAAPAAIPVRPAAPPREGANRRANKTKLAKPTKQIAGAETSAAAPVPTSGGRENVQQTSTPTTKPHNPADESPKAQGKELTQKADGGGAPTPPRLRQPDLGLLDN